MIMVDQAATATAAATTTTSRDRRMLATVLVMAAVGVASLGFAPLEQALPAGVRVPRAALLLQPAILAFAFALAGWWAAPRAGLHLAVVETALAGGDIRAPLRALAVPTLLVGVAGAAILLAYGHLTAQAFAEVPTPAMPLVTRLLYGGVAEEILARWGVLSLVMVGAMKLGIGNNRSFWIANALAALLFGAGHFGLLFTLMPHPPAWLITAVLIGNAAPALGFGWLYRQHGPESAILAHGTTHLLAILLTA